MIKRAIVIFPKFEKVNLIQEIRDKYDPLCHYIAPHITLVFPFESSLSTRELIEHLQRQLVGLEKFELVMRGVTGASDGYIFLDVKKGNDIIIEMHDKLYGGLLREHHNRFIPYLPHLTLGRQFNADQHQAAVTALFEFDAEFRVAINEICVEIIDDQERSRMEYLHRL